MKRLTMAEAAEALRVSPRRLTDIIKVYPFYYPNGRRKLFTERDIEAITEALRSEACRSNSRPYVSKAPRLRAGGLRWLPCRKTTRTSGAYLA